MTPSPEVRRFRSIYRAVSRKMEKIVIADSIRMLAALLVHKGVLKIDDLDCFKSIVDQRGAME